MKSEWTYPRKKPAEEMISPMAEGVNNVKANWASILLLSSYVVSFWLPPPLTGYNFRWFTLLPVAFLAFLFQRQKVSVKGARVFFIVYGLGLMGALISLPRAFALGGINIALQNTFTAFINLVVYLLFLPIITTPLARRVILVLFVVLAIVWSVVIQFLLIQNRVLYYSTFGETGSDKNAVGLLLALACIAMLYMAILWTPPKEIIINLGLPVRIGFLSIGLFLFYSISLIYARSAMLAVAIGLLLIFGILIFKNKKIPGFAMVGILGVLIFFAVTTIWPQVVNLSPTWTRILDSYETRGIDAASYRTRLLEKGWRIIQENPLIGVGIGGVKNFSSISNPDLPIYLIHNQFLSDWAEKGLLGIGANLVWIWFYLRTLRRMFTTANNVDLLWLILIPVLFFEMLFLDISSTSNLFLLMLSGITYNHLSENDSL